VQLKKHLPPNAEPKANMNKQLIAAVTLLAAAAGAQAAAVVGGSTLLTMGYANQLQTWLGKGNITLTSLYVKQAGDTSTTFHNAVDGKGATFTVMYATRNNGDTAIIGGYNKDSWNSSNGWSVDNALGDGNDNFLFNLSTGTERLQTNQYSAYNNVNYGPTFGNGHDLYVDSSLTNAYSYGYSYGSNTYTSLVDGLAYSGLDTRIGALEVFTISAGIASPNADVPEPASLALVGLALTAAGIARRRYA
jgi:hypothetical protein